MKGSDLRQSLYFVAPHQVAVREEPLASPHAGEVVVKTMVSAISPGTELLVYRGQVPTDMPLDSSIPGLTENFAFPVKYGYGAVGRVVRRGADVGPEWQDKLVFCLHPHESHFVATTTELMTVPHGMQEEHASLLPNVEAAVTFLMDGRPMIGEQVAVFGQGVVGLLTTALLSRLPLSSLVTFDLHPLRRTLSIQFGAHRALDPRRPEKLDDLSGSFDLTYELSGHPDSLDTAIALTGFHGRVVIGSWYGERRAHLNLGGSFHRSRMQLISSQVSTIDPGLTGRWNPDRRREVAWRLLAEINPAHLVTHRFPFSKAASAYELLDQYPDQVVQVVLTYDS